MTSRDHTFAIALVASILAHAAIVFVIADDAVSATGAGAATVGERPVEVAYADRAVEPAPPPPRKFEKLLFGDANGEGEAANARRGEEEMLAARDAGQTQAFLSRDPVGMGEIFKEPSMSVLPTGSAAQAAAAVAPPPPPPQPPRVPFGVGETRRVSVPHVTRAAAPTAPPVAGADAPGAAGVPMAAADPAVMSDSESDPFAKRASKDDAVEFRDGRVEARFGRKVKTVRPILSLASQFDLMGMQSPRMVVRIHIHGDGSVRKVDVVKSTGSASADQEVKVALYQWWFEPAKEDVVEFPITWR